MQINYDDIIVGVMKIKSSFCDLDLPSDLKNLPKKGKSPRYGSLSIVESS